MTPVTIGNATRGSRMNRTQYLATGAYLTCPRGESQGHSKLTDATVASMRRQHARKQALIKRLNERYSAAALAKQYGVHVRAVEKALSYATWRHVAENTALRGAA